MLLSFGAQRSLGLVLDMSGPRPTAYSKFLDKELELNDFNGLPGIMLYNSDNDAELHHGGVALHAGESDEHVTFSSMDDGPSPLDVNEAQKEDEQNISEEPGYLPLDDVRDKKALTKGQKKMLQESLVDIERENAAMWSTLTEKPRRLSRQLPRGCKSFLLEIFCGAATLSLVAQMAGYAISAPVDIETGYDLFNKDTRKQISLMIEQEDSYLLSFAPMCGPWSSWQNYNLSRDESTVQKIYADRQWYPVLKWVAQEIRGRLKKGREVLVDNPWSSMLWGLRCMDNLMRDSLANELTGEPLELIRTDQCAYGLVDAEGRAHYKPTGLLLSSYEMKNSLSRRCPGDHERQHIEGSATKRSQQWTKKFCQAMLDGAARELSHQVVYTAYAAEGFDEDRGALPHMDGILDARDLEVPGSKRRRLNLHDLTYEEDLEDNAPPEVEQLLHEAEQNRRREWIKIPKAKRLAIRRLHNQMGHCSNGALQRMLRASMAKPEVLRAAGFFRCQACLERKPDDEPPPVRPTKEIVRFNEELSADVFEIHDAAGARHSIPMLGGYIYEVPCRCESWCWRNAFKPCVRGGHEQFLVLMGWPTKDLRGRSRSSRLKGRVRALLGVDIRFTGTGAA